VPSTLPNITTSVHPSPMGWSSSLPFSDDGPPRTFQGKLCAVLKSGHSGAVRSINHWRERCLVTGGGSGRDTSVRVWNLDSLNSPSIYCGHRQNTVRSCHFVEHGQLIASSGSAVHLWSPETQQTLRCFTYEDHAFSSDTAGHNVGSTNTGPPVGGSSSSSSVTGGSSSATSGVVPTLYHHHNATSFGDMIPMNDNRCRLIATSAFGVSILDPDAPRAEQRFWKLDKALMGTPKCLAWIESLGVVAVGSTTGHISLLDACTGVIQCFWKAHESAITNLESNESRRVLVSAANDKQVYLWNVTTMPPRKVAQRATTKENIHVLTHYNDGATISSSGNKLYSMLLPSAEQAAGNDHMAMKVRKVPWQNTKPERVTSMCMLPNHAILVVGVEDGTLRFGF